MAFSRSILNVSRWRGAVPNALKAGRVDARVGSVASGIIGVKSIQGVDLRIPSNSDAVGFTRTVTLGTSVNISKSFMITNQGNSVWAYRLTGSNTITQTKRVNNGDQVSGSALVVEFY